MCERISSNLRSAAKREKTAAQTNAGKEGIMNRLVIEHLPIDPQPWPLIDRAFDGFDQREDLSAILQSLASQRICRQPIDQDGWNKTTSTNRRNHVQPL